MKAVDYEALTDGTLTLTVVAQDGGRPQLSASVHVNIAVQVRIDHLGACRLQNVLAFRTQSQNMF